MSSIETNFSYSVQKTWEEFFKFSICVQEFWTSFLVILSSSLKVSLTLFSLATFFFQISHTSLQEVNMIVSLYHPLLSWLQDIGLSSHLPLQPRVSSPKRVHLNILSKVFFFKSAYFRLVSIVMLNGLLINPSLLNPPTFEVETHHKGLNNQRDKISYV